MRAAVPDLDDALAEGDAAPGAEWLRENVHRHGSLIPARRLIEDATGGPISPEPLLSYLEEKFARIYHL